MNEQQKTARDNVTIAADMLNRRLSRTELERMADRLEQAARDVRKLAEATHEN